MPGGSISQRAWDRDARRFVGRRRELEVLSSLLTDTPDRNVVLVHGPAGIGKSTLTRELLRRAAALGWATGVVEARDLPTDAAALDAALDELDRAHRSVVVFDSWELAAPLTRHLREQVIAHLPATWVTLVVSRTAPEPAWFQGTWEHVALDLEVPPLPEADARACATAHGATPAEVDRLLAWAGGSPLALAMGAALGAPLGPDGTPRADLAELILTRAVGEWTEHLEVLAVAATARITTPPLLAATVGGDADAHHRWLAAQPFTELLGNGLALHGLVASAVRALLRERAPTLAATTKGAVARHLHDAAVATGEPISVDLALLLSDPTTRWGFGWDETGEHRVDALRSSDLEGIEARLAAADHETWWPVARRLLERAPELAHVVKDHQGRPAGMLVTASTSTPAALVADDPVLGPWLGDARERERRGGRALLWRNATALSQHPGVQPLLGGAGLLLGGVPNPRYLYLPIDPAHPQAMAFSAALGAEHVAQLDVRIGSDLTECHLVDAGPGGIVGAQLAAVLAELGAPPVRSGAEPVPGATPVAMRDAVRDALRDWQRPDLLAACRLAEGVETADRAAHVRGRVLAAIDRAFGESRRDQALRRVVEAAYFERTTSHEQVARSLHLSRATYFRHLREATDRIAAHVT